MGASATITAAVIDNVLLVAGTTYAPMVVVRSYVLRARRDGIRIKLAKASVSSAQEGEQHLPRLQDLAALPAKRECFFFSLSFYYFKLISFYLFL